MYNSNALLGSYVSDSLTLAIKGKYKCVYLWLDADKYKQSIQYVNRFKMFGIDARCLKTDKDPKCYNTKHIKEIVCQMT